LVELTAIVSTVVAPSLIRMLPVPRVTFSLKSTFKAVFKATPTAAAAGVFAVTTGNTVSFESKVIVLPAN